MNKSQAPLYQVVTESNTPNHHRNKTVSEKVEKMQKTRTRQEFEIDLTRADGSGDFKCPKCNVTISPDDQTENTYTIREVKTKRDTLVELLIQCNKCMSLIHLTGFNLTNPTCEQVKKKKPASTRNACLLQIPC